MNEQHPLPRTAALGQVVRCAAATARLAARREVHLRKNLVGTRLCFADGTSARVFRETVVDRKAPVDPCLLVVAFRLRLLRGRWHRLFLWECILNTPLFVGFPGFVTKLWLEADERDNYRGLYEWNDPVSAERYARSLWRILELVCPRGAIRFHVVPGLCRDDLFSDPSVLEASDPADEAWWRLTGIS